MIGGGASSHGPLSRRATVRSDEFPRAAQRGLPRVATTAVLLSIGAVLAFALVGLQNRAARSHRAAHAAMHVENHVRSIDGLEWRAIAGESPDEIMTEVDEHADEAVAQLAAMAEPELADGVAGYVANVKEMLGALVEGDVALAATIDESKVDPAFNVIIERTLEITHEQADRAARTERTVRLLTWILTMTTVVVLSLVLWMFWASLARRRHAAANDRFRSLVSSSRDVITVVSDAGLEIVSPSAGALAELLKADAPISRDFLPETTRAVWLGADDRVAAGHRVEHVELSIDRADGTVLWLDAEGHPLDASARDACGCGATSPGKRRWKHAWCTRRSTIRSRASPTARCCEIGLIMHCTWRVARSSR